MGKSENDERDARCRHIASEIDNLLTASNGDKSLFRVFVVDDRGVFHEIAKKPAKKPAVNEKK